jgi:hypothetical protein
MERLAGLQDRFVHRMSRPKPTRGRTAPRRAATRTLQERAKPATVRHNDGGAWSLAGYTYQLLGSAMARVSLEELVRSSTFTATVRFTLEQHGQDAAATLNRTVRLIQFKYSDSHRRLQPAELAEVLKTLQTSSKGLARGTRTEWFLVTNRPLSPKADRLLKTAQKGSPRGVRKSTTTRSVDAQGSVISRLGKRLRVEHYDADQMEAVVLTEAAKFGVDDPGIVDRAITLMQKTALKSPGRREVSRHAMRDALAGYPQPESIRLEDCRDHLLAELVNIAAAHRGVPLSDAIARTGLQALLLERNAALAAVYGPGGCGKSLSLLKALHDQLDGSSRLAGAIAQSIPAHRRTFSELIDSWRNAPGHTDTPPEALRRAALANPHLQRPVLLLGLDGFDEVAETDRAHAEALILFFHEMHLRATLKNEQPDGLLIVTCRQKEDLHRIIEPLGTGGPELPDVPHVDLSEFTDEEFAEVWKLWFPGEQAPILYTGGNALASVVNSERIPTSHDRLVSALRHPVILGCARCLSQTDREKLSLGDSSEWNRVLAAYSKWFARKAAMRARCSQENVMSVLQAAARTTLADSSTNTYDRDCHWVAPGATETGQPPDVVKRIFQDAVTAGVIVAGSTRFERPTKAPVAWKWHFAALPEYLSALA